MKNYSPLRPHLFKAYYDFILENNLDPFILVSILWKNHGLNIPQECENAVFENTFNLNIAPRAVGSFVIGDEGLSFMARFNGVVRELSIPYGAICGIFTTDTELPVRVIFPNEVCYVLSDDNENSSEKKEFAKSGKTKKDLETSKTRSRAHLKFVGDK